MIAKAVIAGAPRITSNPTSQNIAVGASAVLTIEATASGILSYQWYTNTKGSSIGATAINGAISNTYTITPTKVGASYYYCVVTNTDDKMSAAKIASITSKIVKVAVTA